jgi:hypothetical protein
MVHQFNPADDEIVNDLEADLAKAIDDLAKAQETFDVTWKAIYGTFDRNVGRDAPARFVCRDGYTLARQVTDPKPQLNEDTLHERIIAQYDSNYAAKLWVSITDSVRTLNQNKLAQAVASGRVPAQLVDASLVTPKPVISKHRRKATKEDLKFLALSQDETEEASAASA